MSEAKATDAGSGSGSDSGFDRLRPRSAEGERPASTGLRDAEGKQALFSAEQRQAAMGGVTMTCGHCGQQSVLSGRRALRSLLPSVHLPRPRTSYRSWMRCPACGRRAWVELRLRG